MLDVATASRQPATAIEVRICMAREIGIFGRRREITGFVQGLLYLGNTSCHPSVTRYHFQAHPPIAGLCSSERRTREAGWDRYGIRDFGSCRVELTWKRQTSRAETPADIRRMSYFGLRAPLEERQMLGARLKIPSGAVFTPRVGWRGATKEHGCQRPVTGEQRSQTTLGAKTLRGGRSFACGQRWLGVYSPLRGCARLAALPTAKIPRRSTTRNFQTDSYRGTLGMGRLLKVPKNSRIWSRHLAASATCTVSRSATSLCRLASMLPARVAHDVCNATAWIAPC